MKEKIKKYLYYYYLENYTGLVYLLFSNILSESEFENLIQFILMNNSDFSKYLILNTIEPEQLKKNFSNKELKFFETDKIKKYIIQNLQYLEPLNNKLLTNKSLNLVSIKNYSEQELYAFYLNDPEEFSKIKNDINDKFRIVNNILIEEDRLKRQLLDEIETIKDAYNKKIINSTNRKKLEKILREKEQKIERAKRNIEAKISYLFPKKQFSYMKEIGTKIEYTQTIKFTQSSKLNDIYYDLKLQKTLDGNFEILNERYLFKKYENKIVIYDILNNDVINYNFDYFQKNNNILLFAKYEENITVISNTTNEIHYNKYSYALRCIIIFIFLILISLFDIVTATEGHWIFITMLLVGIGGLIDCKEKNKFYYFWLDTVKAYSQQKKNIMLIKELSNFNSNFQNIYINNIILSNSSLVIDKGDENIKVYLINTHTFEKGYKLKDLTTKRIVENIEDEKEHLRNNLENQVRNLSDANEIIKIKTNYQTSILKLVSLNDALNAFYYSAQTDINNINLDNSLKQIFKFKNETVNNFIISKLNELEYQINDNCILLLKNYCDDELLLINITISFDAMSLYRFLSYKPDKKIEHKFYLYFELVFNKYYLNPKEKIDLTVLHKIKKKLKPICSKTNYLVNHLEFLIQIVGKSSKFIEVTVGNKPDSKDIEISK